MYADGNDASDGTEYTEAFSSLPEGYEGVISGVETLKASFDPTVARYLKIQVTSGATAIDEIEVAGDGCANANEPTAKDDCKNGDWAAYTDDEGTPFANEGDCVSYVATGGSNKAKDNDSTDQLLLEAGALG